jgi:ABC-type nitrate/sulfonate/bicarbonate transport system substrate-binding protein
MKEVKIVGVPEHFNLPWHMCIENGEFHEAGIDLQWTDVPEGTGKMCQMLRDNETDIAIILTEGIIKELTENQHSSIVQIFVKSPLIWGIHVDGKAAYNSVADLENKVSAISRMGSGSHLMSIVNAEKNNWNTNNIPFEIVNNLDGAVASFSEGKSDYFMWEKYTTKPLVDNGTFKRVGECPSPWPCFVIAVRNEFLAENETVMALILEIINTTTEEFKNIPSIDRTLATRYHQKLEDIQQWLQQTQWSQKNLEEKTYQIVQNKLFDLAIITNKVAFHQLIKNL